MRGLVVLPLLLLAACTNAATQLIVTVDSDLPASYVVSVHALARPGDTSAGLGVDSRFDLSGAGGPASFTLPLSFGVVPPDGDAARPVELRVEALDSAGLVTVVRVARTGFVSEKTLHLPIFLSDACRAVTCAPELTCDRGVCVSPEVPVTSLREVRPGDELRDAGAPSALDAGPRPDAGPVVCDEVTTTGVTGAASLGAIAVTARGANVGWGYQAGANAIAYRVPSANVNQLGSVIATATIGVALADDGNIGLLYTSAGFGPRLRWPAGGTTTHALPAYGGIRPLVADGNTFNVLSGTSALTVIRVTTADVASGAMPVTSAAISNPTLGAMANGFLVAYTEAGSCTVQAFDATGVSLGMMATADCRLADATQLDDGRFAVAWLRASDRSVWTAVLSADLTARADEAQVGAANATVDLVQISALAGGHARVAWVDALPSIRSVQMPGWVNERCVVRTGATLSEYGRFRTASRATETLIAFPFGDTVIDARIAD